MTIAALLPMKNNSERVPGKNFKLFNGQTLFHVVLKKLLASNQIHKVIINTDSDIIKADVVKNFPEVLIHERPVELRGDFVSMNEIIAHDIEHFKADLYLQTHSTSPLLNTATIDSAIASYISSAGKNDSLFTVTRLQTRLYWEDGRPVNHNPKELLRTQDLPPVFEENSNFYLFSKDSFYAADRKRIGLKPIMFPIDKIEAADIDEPEDFIIAEKLFQLRYPELC